MVVCQHLIGVTTDPPLVKLFSGIFRVGVGVTYIDYIFAGLSPFRGVCWLPTTHASRPSAKAMAPKWPWWSRAPSGSPTSAAAEQGRVALV